MPCCPLLVSYPRAQRPPTCVRQRPDTARLPKVSRIVEWRQPHGIIAGGVSIVGLHDVSGGCRAEAAVGAQGETYSPT